MRSRVSAFLLVRHTTRWCTPPYSSECTCLIKQLQIQHHPLARDLWHHVHLCFNMMFSLNHSWPAQMSNHNKPHSELNLSFLLETSVRFLHSPDGGVGLLSQQRVWMWPQPLNLSYKIRHIWHDTFNCQFPCTTPTAPFHLACFMGLHKFLFLLQLVKSRWLIPTRPCYKIFGLHWFDEHVQMKRMDFEFYEVKRHSYTSLMPPPPKAIW